MVTAISDGDSLRCAPDGHRVRLLHIDAPELDQRPFGDSARAALRRLVPPGTEIRLETDAETTDRFGRTLAYAWLEDGRMVNETLAHLGYVVALVYPPNERYAGRVRDAVEEARAARRGLWARDAFRCEPRAFRAGRCPAG